MVKICAINHVSLLIADVARSLDFYQGVLGLLVDDSRPDLDYPGAWLKVGGGQVHLLELLKPGQASDVQQHGGRDQHFAVDVVSLDDVVAALDVANIAYTRSRSGRKALFCRDPDGNAIELIELVQDGD